MTQRGGFCYEKEYGGEEPGHRPAFLVGGVGGGEASTSSIHHPQHFIDRSKVRILLCDGEPKSSSEVFELLCNCSYQVISVRTARQVIDALNAQASDIDILLSEIDLPITKGLKMLKYIMRNKELRHIPVVMMSAKDEVSVVVKCLRFGAADYLVKPLRTNELLNLWTHMWRRRRMLGLAEKDILSCGFDLLVSDPSDGNTNSTLLSDDTDDKSKAMLQETEMSNLQELESKRSSAAEVEHDELSEHKLDVPEDRDKSGRILSCPKKSELKVGESSAFFTYIKSSEQTKHFSRHDHTEIPVQSSSNKDKYQMPSQLVERSDWHGGVSCSADEDGFTDFENVNLPPESSECRLSDGQSSYDIQLQKGDGQVDASGVSTVFRMPYYFPGMMSQNVMHSCPLYQGGFHDVQIQGSPLLLPPYNSLPQGPQVPVISSFPYYPVNLGLQSEQVHSSHVWPLMPTSSTPEGESGRIERREAALLKFRQKRKERCFDKKVRYVNRKRLAERRPRVRGQFVRQLNGVNVDPNGCPTVDGDSGDEEEEYEEESVPREVGVHSSPEPDAAVL